MMVVMDRPFADYVPAFIRDQLSMMMIVMDHIGVVITVDLRHTIIIVVSHGS